VLHETIQGIPAARLDPGAIGHEIGSAGRPNGVALLLRWSLCSDPMYLDRYRQCGKCEKFEKPGHDATPSNAAAEPAFMCGASLLDLRAHCQPSLLRQDTSLPFGTVIGNHSFSVSS
jgi:hypothetical protein